MNINIEAYLFRIIVVSIVICGVAALYVVLEYKLFVKQFKKRHPQAYKNYQEKQSLKKLKKREAKEDVLKILNK